MSRRRLFPSSRRNVAIVLPYLNSYRLRFLELLGEELDRKEVALRVFVGSPVGVDVRRSDEALAQGATKKVRQVRLQLGARSLNLRFLPREASQSDLIIMEQATRNIDTWMVLCFRRRKAALWGHGFTITKPQPRLFRILQGIMLRRAHWFFAYTEGSAERARALGVLSPKITVVNNSVDTNQLRQLIERTRSDASGKPSDSGSEWKALFIGVLDSSKRLEFLVDAALRIHGQDGRFRLLVAGKGPNAEILQPLVDRGIVRLLGTVGMTEKAALALETEAMLMPGRVGLVAVDAFAMGLPIVTTDWEFQGPEFDYLDERCAVITGDDSEVYASAVLDLMRNPGKLEKLKDGARLQGSIYTAEAMATRFASGVISALEARA